MSETALLYEVLSVLKRIDVRVNERLARIELDLKRIQELAEGRLHIVSGLPKAD